MTMIELHDMEEQMIYHCMGFRTGCHFSVGAYFENNGRLDSHTLDRERVLSSQCKVRQSCLLYLFSSDYVVLYSDIS